MNWFFATEEDVVGFWVCKSVSPVLQFTNKSDTVIMDTLLSKDYIYKNWYLFDNTVQGQNTSTQILALSASSMVHGDHWDLKIAVDMLDVSNSNHMQVWQCTLDNAQPFVKRIHSNIDVNYTMTNWAPFFQAGLYRGFNSDHPDVGQGANQVAAQLELMLNSVIMVAGTGNSIDIENPGSDYGCLHSGTWIAIGIISMVFLVFAMVAFFIFYWIYLKISIFRARRQYDRSNTGQSLDSKELDDSVPNSLLDWVAHAAHESKHSGERPKHHHLSKWHLSARFHGGRRVGLVPEHRSNWPQSDHAAPTMIGPSPGMSAAQDFFLGQKTGYNAVHTSEEPMLRS